MFDAPANDTSSTATSCGGPHSAGGVRMIGTASTAASTTTTAKVGPTREEIEAEREDKWYEAYGNEVYV